MSRPLFFTGRREIPRSCVAFRLVERDNAPTHFEATIDLSGLRLPDDAGVVIEGYHNMYLERFPIVTVAQMIRDRGITCEMRGLEAKDRASFRLKVVSNLPATKGQLLASIDRIRPETEDDTGAAGSILPLIPKSREQMGSEFWRVHFQEGGELQPELWVNKDVHGLVLGLQNQDPKLTALIMPEVLRQVLRGLVEDDAEWTEEGVLGQWLAFARELHEEFASWDGQDVDGSRQDRRDWVDQVVKRFAASHRFFERYHDQAGIEGLEVET